MEDEPTSPEVSEETPLFNYEYALPNLGQFMPPPAKGWETCVTCITKTGQVSWIGVPRLGTIDELNRHQRAWIMMLCHATPNLQVVMWATENGQVHQIMVADHMVVH